MDERELRQLGTRFAEREAADAEAYPAANIDELRPPASLRPPLALDALVEQFATVDL